MCIHLLLGDVSSCHKAKLLDFSSKTFPVIIVIFMNVNIV